MFSARELIAAGLLLFAAAGCATDAITPPLTKLSPAPIHEDEAMALRQWDTVSSRYANQTAPAYPTLYPLVPRRDLPEPTSIVTAPAIFLWQTAVLPLQMLDTPPWQDTVYRGAAMPPTYTAVPVVADDAGSYRTITRFPHLQRRR